MQTYQINFSILSEPRTDSFCGVGRSDLQNVQTTVQAQNIGQAQAIIESQYGGSNTCIVHGVQPIW